VSGVLSRPVQFISGLIVVSLNRATVLFVQMRMALNLYVFFSWRQDLLHLRHKN
jgi:hypothetical protein